MRVADPRQGGGGPPATNTVLSPARVRSSARPSTVDAVASDWRSARTGVSGAMAARGPWRSSAAL